MSRGMLFILDFEIISIICTIVSNLFINTPLGVGYFDNRHPAGVFPDL